VRTDTVPKTLLPRNDLNTATAISLYFVDAADPILVKVTYRPEGSCQEILSVRGKTGGAFDTERTFQWTAAVQGLAVLMLKKALCMDPYEEVTLSGGQGSVAASFDYALDKQPAWLADMFGLTTDGTTAARKLFRRTNPGRKSKGPVVIGINKSLLSTTVVTVFWNDSKVTDQSSLTDLLLLLQQKAGLERSCTISQESRSQPVVPAEVSDSSEPSLFKTPFILRHTHEGCAFTRLYQHGGSMFLVASFGPPNDLPEHTSTPVRLQFDCPASSALEWADCDCSGQLEDSLRIARAEHGVLIHLVPESSAANLFSSYLGSTDSGRGFFSSLHSIPPSEVRSAHPNAAYDAVSAILKDLAISHCDLITNNLTKVRALQERGISVSHRSIPTQVTPQNLGFLFAQSGKNLVDDMRRDRGISFCVSRSWERTNSRTWIIGGEDTLWEDNIYYEDFIRKFIDHIAGHLGEQSRSRIRTVLDSCSLTNTHQNGYGPVVFEQTLKLAWATLRQFYGEHFRVPYPMHIIDRAAETLLQIPIRVQTEGEELLWRIREAGERAVLFTQGPIDIQLLKTAKLNVAPFFDAIAYVSHKTDDSFKNLLSILKLSPQSVVVVGNNLSTEIQPAVNLGIPAIHYDNPNGWASLSRTTPPPHGYRKIRNLKDLDIELRESVSLVAPLRRVEGAL
jgi:putative hydrolase of the HAD superfamily